MGYTLDQLQAAGFSADPENPSLTRAELEAMGFKPPEDPMRQAEPVDVSRLYEPRIGKARAAGLGALQGATLGFADELGAAAGSLTPQSSPVVLGKQFDLSPDDTPEIRRLKLQALDQQLAAVTDNPLSYEALRDRYRTELEQAQRQRPAEYTTGELAASLATSAVPGLGAPGMGGKVVGNAARLLAQGAGTGAAAGLGASNEPLVGGQLAGDALKGAGLGAAGGLVGAGIGRAAPALVRGLGRKAQGTAIDAARSVMLSGAKQLGDKGRVKMPDEVPLQVLKEGAILPFGTTQGTLKRIAEKHDEAYDIYRSMVDKLEEAGVPGPNARMFARDLILRATEIRPMTTIDAIPELYRKEAEGAVARAMEGARLGIAPRGRLGLRQAEALKSSLMAQARYGKIEDTPINEARQEIASMLRQRIEDEIAAAGAARPGSEVAEMAESFVPVKQRLGRLIEAERATMQGVQRASTRQSGPGVIEMAAATSTGNAAPLFGRVALDVARNRLPSTIAYTAHQLSRGLTGAGNLMSRVPQASRMSAGAGLGAAATRALAMDPEGEEERRRKRIAEALKAKQTQGGK